MGIVIINGKRYDSVTGLMLSDQTSDDVQTAPEFEAAITPVQKIRQEIESADRDEAANATDESASAGMPSWIASYVDEKAVQPANNQTKVAAEAPAQPKAESAPSYQPRRAMHARHGVSASRTLNRRFVKKPLGETGHYAESMAEKHFEAEQVAKAAAAKAAKATADTTAKAASVATKETKESAIPVRAHAPKQPALSMWRSAKPASSKSIHIKQTQSPTEHLSPVLTRRQAESISRLNQQQAPFAERVTQAEQEAYAQAQPAQTFQQEAPAYQEALSYEAEQPARQAINLSQTVQSQANRSDDDDDILNERLDQLSQILQNVQDLEAEQNQPARQPERAKTKANRTSRKAAKATRQTAKQAKASAPRAKRRFRAPAILATAGAMAAIAGIGVYMAMPTVSVKLAANKAGIDVKNPYIPAGYSIDNDVAYQTGRVTVNYRSKNGSDGYSITQETSSDSDATLRQQISEQNGGYYQEYNAGGQKVLLYRDKITWLKDGMKYTIDSNDYLDTTQITDIVKSM